MLWRGKAHPSRQIPQSLAIVALRSEHFIGEATNNPCSVVSLLTAIILVL